MGVVNINWQELRAIVGITNLGLGSPLSGIEGEETLTTTAPSWGGAHLPGFSRSGKRRPGGNELARARRLGRSVKNSAAPGFADKRSSSYACCRRISECCRQVGGGPSPRGRLPRKAPYPALMQVQGFRSLFRAYLDFARSRPALYRLMLSRSRLQPPLGELEDQQHEGLQLPRVERARRGRAGEERLCAFSLEEGHR